MAKRTPSKTLSIWTNGQSVGRWTILPSGESELQYAPNWIASALGRPLSLSLPFSIGNRPIQGAQVNNYFDHLLPDNDSIRQRLVSRFQTSTARAFDLLRAIGRDCVGAVQLLGEDEEPMGFDRIEGKAMSAADVEAYLMRVTAPPRVLGQLDDDPDDFRISLAGAQEKTALLWHQQQWHKPQGATPTTHIFKLPLGMVGAKHMIDMNSSVENEWLCLQILRSFGLPVAEASMQVFGKRRALIVTRFDRQLHSSGQWWLRLPQEDFCQVTRTPAAQKYEEHGGPGIRSICKWLEQSTHAERDLRTFLMSQILFWLLGATDGHAKNFSLRLLAQGRYELTPLYDVLSIWPVVGGAAQQIPRQKAKMAMAVWAKNRHYKVNQIQRRHFNATAKECGFSQGAEPMIQEILERTQQILAKVQSSLPLGFPEAVSQPILAEFAAAAGKLSAMPED